ncbi:MAG: hypothetical protein KW793_01990 [Candidatus Doudnabacteria bacterium]|nr:hypothetical protein [Candidatus Doudnabacteria bacterium]
MNFRIPYKWSKIKKQVYVNWLGFIFIAGVVTFLVVMYVLPRIDIDFNTSDALTCPLPLQSCIDTTMPVLNGTTINVPAGGDLQGAINSAQLGDTIIVQAGATYIGPIVLKNKAGSGWIIIKSSSTAQLPPSGSRVGPQHASLMAKIVSPGGNQTAMMTEASAHNYRIIGIEFAKINSAAAETNLVALGEFSTNSLSAVANNLVLDRVYAHGDTVSNLRRCIALNSAVTSILDSYVSNCFDDGADSQAIGGWNGPGPFKIINNYLEGAGENVLFGGADPAISGLISSDIEFRGNYVFKPLSWQASGPTYDGRWRVVKNSFELKNAQRVLIEGNIIRNHWGGQGQSGWSVVYTPRNQDGTCSWCVVRDVTFRNNIIDNVDGGFNMLGLDDANPSQQTDRILIQNNLMTNVSRGFQTNGLFNLTIDHNTIFNSATVSIGYDVPHKNFIFTNNIYSPADYGFTGDNSSEGLGALGTYFPGYVFQKNIATGRAASFYPSGNFFPATFTDVGFVDYSGGNYALGSSSPYKNGGTDGKDIGADYTAVKTITANVVSGNGNGDTTPPPPAPLPPPPPPPAPLPLPPPPPSGSVTSISTTSLIFGPTGIGSTSASQFVSLINSGGTATALGQLNITGDYNIAENFCNLGIQPNTHCDVYVSFTPRASGARSGQLKLTETNGTIHTVSLSGTGVTVLQGDVNNDKIVNSIDWSYMNSKWLTNDPTADLNKDGVVNSIDFSIMNSNWLKTSP